jgi:GAF domain-containing protein
MAQADDLLGELGRLAALLGPAVRPVGADQLLRTVAQAARQLFGARACSLALLSEDGDELVYTTASGEGEREVPGMRLPSGTGIAGWVVMSGQPVAVEDLASDARFARGVAEETGYVPRALLAVPVVSGEEVLGVLTLLDRDEARPGSEQDMALLSVFAEQAALALVGQRAFGDLGRVLLQAVAEAAEQGSALRDAVTAAADDLAPPDADLAELAVVLAELDRLGPGERRLAVRLVREVAAHAAGRPGRRSPRRG